MNNWDAGKLIKVILAVQLAMLGLVGLAAVGLDIPVIRQFIGYIYLAFIPGYLLLVIFRLHKLGIIETILYSVGLSLAFNMFLGLAINSLYPLISISRPISILPLIITWTVVLGMLCFIAYKRGKDFSISFRFEWGELLSLPILLLILLPLLSALGAQLVKYYQNNILLIVLIVLIVFTMLLAIFTKFIPERLYPLAIFSIALALVWHTSLISNYLTGYDDFYEYFFYGLAAQSGHWNLAIADAYNSMLSITVLPAIFSSILGMEGTLVFKITYTVLLALVPVGSYFIFLKLLNKRYAFLAAFLIISIHVFYETVPFVAREVVGELFFVLLIMLFIDREKNAPKRALFFIFCASLVVSHYSMTYIFTGFLALSLIISPFIKQKNIALTAYYTVGMVVMSLAWYAGIGRSQNLKVLIIRLDYVYHQMFTNFLNPSSREVVSVVGIASNNVFESIYRILYYLIILFIALGFIKLIMALRKGEISKEYATLSIGNYILMGACAVIPVFSLLLGLRRDFHLASLTLAPFCILGVELVFNLLSRALRPLGRFAHRLANTQIVISILLALFLLFETGLLFQVTGDSRLMSLPLGLATLTDSKSKLDAESRVRLLRERMTEQDVLSAEWLSDHWDKTREIYATHSGGGAAALSSYGLISIHDVLPLSANTTLKQVANGYVYLDYINVVLGFGRSRSVVGIVTTPTGDTVWSMSRLSGMLTNCNRIYTSNENNVYQVPSTHYLRLVGLK